MKIFTIESNDADQRVDKFCKKIFPYATLGNIYKFLRTKQISVNRKKVDPAFRISLGDTMEVFLSDESLKKLQESALSITKKPSTADYSNIAIKDWIVFEDADILALNKPPFLNVHGGDHKTTEVSLIQIAQDYLGEAHQSISFKPSLAHRLDRNTSGLILIGKTKSALSNITQALKERQTIKIYLALCLGAPEQKRGTINKKIWRKEDVFRENKVVLDEEKGQVAATRYAVVQENIAGKYSLIACLLETGRMHQIRIHLASIGIPIIGDDTYGNKKENAAARANEGISRQFLHSFILQLPHPKTEKPLWLEAYPSADMIPFLEKNNITLKRKVILNLLNINS